MAAQSQPGCAPKSAVTDVQGFTPGPWRALANLPIVTRDRTGFYPADPTGNVEICRVGNWPDKELRPYNGDRWMADARLIASAPDLYEALRELCDENGNAILGMALGLAALEKASPSRRLEAATTVQPIRDETENPNVG